MTMLVGINFGEYILIAADKGGVNERGFLCCSEQKKIIKGKSEKIYITGTGFIKLLDKVKNRIKNNEISEIGKIINIINLEKDDTFGILHMLEYKVNIEKEKENNGFLFTYKEKEKIQLAIHYPAWCKIHYNYSKKDSNEKGFTIEKGDYIVTPPAEFNRDNGTYQRILHIIDNCIKSERNKEKELEVLKEVFLIMSQNSKQVTKEFDYYFVS